VILKRIERNPEKPDMHTFKKAMSILCKKTVDPKVQKMKKGYKI
jgi:hypothetical protein